jgi:hypothetical protein
MENEGRDGSGEISGKYVAEVGSPLVRVMSADLHVIKHPRETTFERLRLVQSAN